MQLKQVLLENYAALELLFNSIKVGIFIIDGNGTVLHVNEASAKTGGLAREEQIGRNMHDLAAEGYVEESASLLSLSSRKEEALVQSLGDGGKVFIFSVPVMSGEEIDVVICTERDITETMQLRELLEEKQKITEEYEKEIDFLKQQTLLFGGEIIAESYIMKNLLDNAARVAKSDMTVLLTGESGTGKELIANYIYRNSKRVGKPFLKINCAAMPENLMESELFGYERGAFTGAEKTGKAGIFEIANHGTLFLDEIAELPPAMQAKLLRVIQEKEIMKVGGSEAVPVDVRIVAATNRDLMAGISDGSFREDLYYRLNAFPIETPPLRKRKGDIKKLTLYFMEELNRKYKKNKFLTEGAFQTLAEYDWPGNVRELRNVLERLMISTDRDCIGHFQVKNHLYKRGDENFPLSRFQLEKEERSLQNILLEVEKELILTLIEQGFNATETAKILQVDKSTISRKLKRYEEERLRS